MDVEVEVGAFSGGAVSVGRDSEGAAWVGTRNWLIVDDSAAYVPAPEVLDKATKIPAERVELERHRIKGRPVLLACEDGHVCQIFARPDGEFVFLDKRYVDAIESALEDEDENDGSFAVLRWWQAEDHDLSVVGVTQGAERERMAAVIMPVRINEPRLDVVHGR